MNDLGNVPVVATCVESLNKTLYPDCSSPLSCEMSTVTGDRVNLR